ncbi:unnamed protein product [Echinostoma caproni]|uniref:Copper transporter n=1 Tax=Echinostoma caproni TaxID=27848 RepID=A0A183AFQ7_9TREM|nr:unnamed protein product [Echinostoma caproni]
MRDSDDHISPLEAESSQSKQQKRDRLGRCGLCMKRMRLPNWIRRLLFLLYTWFGGALTYALLITAVYTAIMSLRPSVALPPKCRRMAVPIYLAPTIDSENDTTTIAPVETTVNPTGLPKLPSGFTVGLECRQGEAMSVLLFYAFGFIVGEIMEMMHLPGLFGNAEQSAKRQCEVHSVNSGEF